MNSSRVQNCDADRFAYDHSASQQAVVEQVFEAPDQAARPNDRLRNAGPMDGWPAGMGDSVRLLLFDADKNHQFHPTTSYDVQIGWYEGDRWMTVQKSVTPDDRTLSLDSSKLYGMTQTVQDVLCMIGVDEIQSGGGNFNLCELTVDEMADAFLPTFQWPLPYQDVKMPTPNTFTRYYWRFRTNNGTYASGWTGWSSVYRSL